MYFINYYKIKFDLYAFGLVYYKQSFGNRQIMWNSLFLPQIIKTYLIPPEIYLRIEKHNTSCKLLCRRLLMFI